MRVFEVRRSRPGRLAVVTRPGTETIDEELAELRRAGFDRLVSVLSEPELTELGLRGERAAAEAAGLAFDWHPVNDFSVPTDAAFVAGLRELHGRLGNGAAIAAHCRGSVGRSPLLIASLLVLDGLSPDDAWRAVSEARGLAVPDTDEQRRWMQRSAHSVGRVRRDSIERLLHRGSP